MLTLNDNLANWRAALIFIYENFNYFKDALSNYINYFWFDVGFSLSELFW